MSHSATAKRREYDRHYKAPSGVRVGDSRLIVPDEVERRDVHTPCFHCEARGGCRHRPWVVL